MTRPNRMNHPAGQKNRRPAVYHTFRSPDNCKIHPLFLLPNETPLSFVYVHVILAGIPAALRNQAVKHGGIQGLTEMQTPKGLPGNGRIPAIYAVTCRNSQSYIVYRHHFPDSWNRKTIRGCTQTNWKFVAETTRLRCRIPQAEFL